MDDPFPELPRRPLQVAVSGAGRCDAALDRRAEELGRRLAQAGVVVLTGGMGGVMEAASRGARRAGGRTVGILPGTGAADSPPNDGVELAVYTGLGQGRNLVLVLSAAVVIAVGGGWGTLSEVAQALKHRIPVVVLDGAAPRRPDGAGEPLVRVAATPREAVELALEMAVDRT